MPEEINIVSTPLAPAAALQPTRVCRWVTPEQEAAANAFLASKGAGTLGELADGFASLVTLCSQHPVGAEVLTLLIGMVKQAQGEMAAEAAARGAHA